MKRFLSLLLAIAVFIPFSVQAKKDDEGLAPQYQIQGAGTTTSNARQVMVSIITKKKDKVTDADLEKAAVHGVLFRDYDDTTNTGFGFAASHKAIMETPTAEAQYIDFFKPFFQNGDYKNYVQVVSDSRRVVKVGKEWKVSAKVIVNTSALKKMLVKQGMAKNLGTAW